MFFVCKQCKEVFEGRQGEEKRMFCSSYCYNKFKKDSQRNSCPHNQAVECDDRYYCFKCGWNPAVEQRRKELLV